MNDTKRPFLDADDDLGARWRRLDDDILGERGLPGHDPNEEPNIQYDGDDDDILGEQPNREHHQQELFRPR